ncbi:MAG: adenylosuccinate lyase [Proteobacteria bacterium]|nr:adenylosuccinate lyase [Pseudomonadota bacterium]MBU1708476.1 adenylosuccinate lyase [Pseudomonadota bacterium]
MPVHPFDYTIQANLYSTPELNAVFEEKKRLERWLQIEAALAQAQGELGIIPQEAAAEISGKASLDNLDLKSIQEDYLTSRNSLMPLLKALRNACSDNYGEYVHFGATTQDIIDTAQILALKDTLAIIYRDLRALEEILLNLSKDHCSTPIIARTHGQQAQPTTLGYKFTVWLSEIRRHIERLKTFPDRIFIGQLSGAVGNMAALGPQAFEVSRLTMNKLGLGYSLVSWHTSRDNIAEAAAFHALLISTLEKIANEIIQLGKSEIYELSEPAPKGATSSSTMPHKRNPVLCQRISVLARHVRPLAGIVVEGMVHEHERDARALWSEWLTMPQIAIYTGTALHYLKIILNGLIIRPGKMLENLSLQKEHIISEWLLFQLAKSIGKMNAQKRLHTLIAQSVETGQTLHVLLSADNEISPLLDDDELEYLKHPERYTGLAESIVKETVKDITNRRTTDPEKL